jgi:hypothetical protein
MGAFRAVPPRVCATFVLVLAVGWLAGAAGQARAAGDCPGVAAGFYNPDATLRFQGTFTDDDVSHTTHGYQGFASYSSTFTWTVIETGPINDTRSPGCFPSPDEVSVDLSGSVRAATTAQGENNGAKACNGSISKNSDSWPASASTWLNGATQPPSGSGNWLLSVFGSAPPSNVGGLLSSSASIGCDINGGYWAGWVAPYFGAGGGSDPKYNGTAGDDFVRPSLTAEVGGGTSPNGQLTGTTSKTWSFSDKGSDGADGTDAVSGKETLSIQLGRSTSTPPSSHQPSPAELQARQHFKDATKTSLKHHFSQALYPCLVATTGATLSASGYLMAFSPGFGAGLSLLGAGTPMVAVAGPICTKLIGTIRYETQTVNDPPDTDYQRLAEPVHDPARSAPTPCGSFSGTTATLCKSLGAKFAELETTLGSVESDAAAIETTVSRETTAINAGNVGAASRQAAHASKLEVELAAAEKAQTRASGAVAKVLDHYHITIALDAGKFSDAWNGLLDELATNGISRTTLTGLLGTAPTRLDEVNELRRPYS